MANSGVAGKVVSQSGAAAPGLVVGAYAVGGLFGERLLRNTANPNDKLFADHAITKADGSFSVAYEQGTHDIFVRVFSRVKRVLGLSPVHTGVSTTLFSLPAPITVDTDDWLVTGGEFPQVFTGNDVDARVDNHDAWQEIVEAVDKAQSTVHFMLFYLDLGKSFMEFTPDPPTPNVATQGKRLEDALKGAGARGVAVRLLCNQLTYSFRVANPHDVPYPFNSAARVEQHFAIAPGVEVRRFRMPAYTPCHTKFVVIDNATAFVIGSPFVQDYYDVPEHRIDDARHGAFPDKKIDSHGIRVPTHDVSLRVRGPALDALNRTFLLHWNTAAPSGTIPLQPPAPPAAIPNGMAVQVVRSLTGNSRFTSMPHGETTILEAYLRAISSARSYIYLENQYFTCDEIADALVLAIKQRSSLELIFLTNNAVDIPGYATWQPETIQRVLDGLSADERKRVGFYTIWSHESGAQASDPTQVCRNYIHSKVAIVDDAWATVGSANLDGDSLSFTQNAVRGGWWILGGLAHLRADGVLRENRESETNLVVFSNVANQPTNTFASDLRKRLWAEHLGFVASGQPNPNDPALAAPPQSAGWLKLWNDRAQAKLAGLLATPITTHPARILRYPYFEPKPRTHADASDPAKYLKYFAVDVSKVALRPRYRRYDWTSGKFEDWETGKFA
jgi:phosphatidylserine/phosphatidylglycerophosphate/cardiolipin synthase-like enzyme